MKEAGAALMGQRAERSQDRLARPAATLPDSSMPVMLPLHKSLFSIPLPQGHEKCALMILAETQDLGLINATNSALQM